MTDWLTIRDCVVAGALLVMFLLTLGALFGRELRKLSLRGGVVFALGAVIATGVAQKRMTPDGGDSLRHDPSLAFLLRGSLPIQPERCLAYTNPVRFVSFAHSSTAMTVSVAWDWTWSPDAYYHFVDFYGTYGLPSSRWVDVGRVRIRDWGEATNLTAVLQWPTVFSNAVASGTFPTNATLAAGFLSAFPELDTDGDGLPDGDEVRIYGTRWDLWDSDNDGIDDPDELFDVGTDPMNPDSDGDGMPDGWEWYCGLDPNDPLDVLGDYDLDGLGNHEEAMIGTRPDCSDTDGDRISDYDEVRLYGTDPCLADTDGDGMDDHEEILRGFDPCFAGEYHGPVRPDGYNPNAYYSVGITADEPMTWIAFDGDGDSDLADPSFFIRTNETVEVALLMGKTYRVLATNAIGVVSVGDPGIAVVTNAPGDLTIVRPVTVALLPEYNLMSFGAGSFGSDGSFRMGVSPDVGGVIDWTNSCCAITSRGNRFWFACDGNCSCGGCFASGCLRYEGYALPCVGGFCGCPHGDGDLPTEEDDGPHAAAVSIVFSERAVIFEDAYTNAPGEVVGRRSTATTLSCTAHGGPRGARLSLLLSGSEKLAAVSGQSVPMSTRFIPPGQKLDFEIEYEGVQPSEAADDIVATAVLVEEETYARFVASNKMTSVRLQLEAVYEAPENPNPSRHVYGVGEKVRILFSPESVTPRIESYRINPYESYYDMLNGAVYTCPITSDTPSIQIYYADVVYDLLLTIVEPSSVFCSGTSWNGGDLWPFQVGGSGMSLTNYVYPSTVSFQGVLVAEVPCYDPIQPSGYFATTNYIGSLTHCNIYVAGAAMAKRIGQGNYWTVDHAAYVGEYLNWSDGRLVWKIPIGWFRQRFEGDDERLINEAENENPHNLRSRRLLIGGRDDLYKQIFSISEEGTSSVEKHGHRASRTILGSKSIVRISEEE